MKLFLVTGGEDAYDTYDTYDSFVICCESEEDARLTHPRGHRWDGASWGIHDGHSWTPSPEKVIVKYLGEASPDLAPGIVVDSFNAG